MSKKESIKRLVLCIVSFLILAVGVAFTKVSGLGVSPISSFPNVLSIGLPFMTIGNWTIIYYLFMILAQYLMLRKDFKIFQLLQIPFSFLFGFSTDLNVWLLSHIAPDSYIMQLVFTFIGIAILGFGIMLAVSANVIMNSPEATVQAISIKTGKEFGTIKTIFDISCVTAAIIISFILCGKVVGIREGTIISAICVGFAVKLSNKLFKAKVMNFLTK